MAEKKAASKAGAKGGSKAGGGSKGGGSKAGGGAFMAPVTPDEALAAVIGAEPMPRTEITKRIWDYIRSNNLQDQNDKRTIKADAKLKKVFDGRDSVSMFEMTKLVNSHVKK